MSPYETFNFLVLSIISLAIILTSFWVFSNIYFNNGDASKTYYNNRKPTIVVSESMEPIIMTNSVIVVEKTPFSDIIVGDIILAEVKEHGMVVHRVIEDKEGQLTKEVNGKVTQYYGRYLVTKGDNNLARDKWVVIEGNFQGKVVQINNELSGLLTFYFRDITKAKPFEIIWGLLLIALTLSGFIVLIVWLYDYLLIPYFLKREVSKRRNLDEVKKIYYSWLKDRVVEKDAIDTLNQITKKRSVISKGRFNFRLMMWHNAMKAESKRAMISKRRYEKLKGVFKYDEHSNIGKYKSNRDNDKKS